MDLSCIFDNTASWVIHVSLTILEIYCCFLIRSLAQQPQLIAGFDASSHFDEHTEVGLLHLYDKLVQEFLQN
jgi:hypothetical protein